jgi:sulfhydrogenase subunit gamma (sulfur reductase)
MQPAVATGLHAVAVRGTWDESRTLRAIVLAAGELAAGHTVPGQVLQVSLDGVSSYFGLTSAPRAGELELLVRRGTPLTDALCRLVPGERVLISTPEGPGFPVERHAGHDLLLVAAGSGIGPVRAVLQHIVRHHDGARGVRLIYGQRDPDEFAYTTELDSSGARVERVVSGPDPTWTGLRGRIQHVLRQHPAAPGSVAYLCGMEEMVAEVTPLLVAQGVPPDEIFTNT